MSRSRVYILTALAFAVVAIGCSSSGGSSSGGASTTTTTDASPAGDIPDTQAFVAFTAPSGAYTIKVPEGWAQSTAGSKATFTDHFNTVSIDATTSATAPTPATVRAVDVPLLQQSSSGFNLGGVDTVARTAGPATVVTYRVNSAPDAVTGKRIALDAQQFRFWRTGELVTVTLSAPHGSDNVDAWKMMTNSFAWSQ